MNPRDVSEQNQRAALEAYRDAACAEADAHFDERALEAQRQKIMARLAHLGQSAKVLRFPLSSRIESPATGVNRGWISAAAAAGLLLGVLGGQFVHFLPGDQRRVTPIESNRPALRVPDAVPALVSYSPDDGLLDDVDFAVQLRSASELRALDELTPYHEPR